MTETGKPRRRADSRYAAKAEPRTDADDASNPRRKEWFKMVTASKVIKREVEWLWKGFLPRGTVSLLTGDPQAGKSTLVCELVACLSTGRPLPGETEEEAAARPPMKSWIMSSEDAADTTIIWRLINQGADLDQIYITDERAGLEGRGLREMERIIREENIGLVSIDTITTWMGGEIDMNKGNEVMTWINGLKEITDRTGCSIIMIRHRRKGAPGDNKLHAGMGSIGFTAAVRSELMAYVKKDGTRVLERTKGNIGAPPLPLAYNIRSSDDPTNPHGVLDWCGTWDEPLPTDNKPRVSTRPKAFVLAQEFIAQRLAAGPVPAMTMLTEAAERGISETTLKRAKEGIAKSVQISKNEWVWSLLDMQVCR
jgi:hypothetical protein